jgi:hypothetical protein
MHILLQGVDHQKPQSGLHLCFALPALVLILQ